MPTLTTDDGVKLYYEEAGSGAPVVFVHEFGGDHRSWEPQVRYFSRRYRCIAFNARGYPPSDVPEDFERYSQARARRHPLRAGRARYQRAHVVGLSMGAFATLHFGMTYGYRAISITVAGGGYGSHPAQYREFQATSKKNAELIKREGAGALRRHLRARTAARAARDQGPARLRGTCASSRSTRRSAPSTRCSACSAAAVVLRPDRRNGAHGRADAHHVGRRGGAVPGSQPAHEAHDPDRGARDPAAQRARSTSRSRRSSTSCSRSSSTRWKPGAGAPRSALRACDLDLRESRDAAR